MSAVERAGPHRSEAQDDDLVRRALEARERAWSPYSKVRVGAALLARDGRTFTGCNVENASFGLTLCAERTALVKAVSEGAREFVALAVATSLPRVVLPCGACRQVLHEFAPALRVIAVGDGGARAVSVLGDLLPEAFGPADLA